MALNSSWLACVVLGAIVDLGAVLGFSDIMILCMAIPNIAGAILLSGRVRAALDDYRARFLGGKRRSTRRASFKQRLVVSADESSR